MWVGDGHKCESSAQEMMTNVGSGGDDCSKEDASKVLDGIVREA